MAGQKNQNIEVSLRATHEFCEQSGVHLGKDIAQPLGGFLRGMGGGHSSAAGANGTGDPESALKRCLLLLKERLANQP